MHFLLIEMCLKLCGNLIKVCPYEAEPFIKCPGLVYEHPFVLQYMIFLCCNGMGTENKSVNFYGLFPLKMNICGYIKTLFETRMFNGTFFIALA